MDFLIYHIMVVVLTFFSAFFSGAETAVISANKITLSALKDKKRFGASRALYLANNLDEVISMILIGNNICNIAATSFVTLIAVKAYLLNESMVFLVTLVQAFIFLLICEILPKIISRFNSDLILRVIAYPLYATLVFLKPLTKVSLLATRVIKKWMVIEPTKNSFKRARDEISVLFQLGEKSGVIDKIYKNYVDDILSLRNITVRAVMTPTIDVLSVEIKQGIKSVIKLIKETRFSRIPVYKDRVDNIVGYIYYRDLLNSDMSKLQNIEDIMRKPEYVPVTKPIYKLFKEMENSKKHMVFAVNEYGAVIGIVTREDIAEEIVGEIQTKDHPEEQLIRPLSNNKFSLSGSLDIDYFSKYFKINIKKRAFETVAGYLLYIAEHIPKKGEKITHKDQHFIIEEATDKEIIRVIFTPASPLKKK